MRASYATASDMQGKSYGSNVILITDPKREATQEIRRQEKVNEIMETIVEIDRMIVSGKLAQRNLKRLELKRKVLLGKVAFMDIGKSA
jgi:hypothetical protein